MGRLIRGEKGRNMSRGLEHDPGKGGARRRDLRMA